MSSKLHKPLGLKPPQFGIHKPLATIKGRHLRIHETPPSKSRCLLSPRFKRRSKSVTDVGTMNNKHPVDFNKWKLAITAKTPQIGKKPLVASKNSPLKRMPTKSTSLTNTVKNGMTTETKATKRPPAISKKNDVSSDGSSKPKVAKKIPDWDYKGRFMQLNEKYTVCQQTMKEMKIKISEYEARSEEIEASYAKIQNEAQELAVAKEALTAKCEELSSANKKLLLKNYDLEKALAESDEKIRWLEADLRVFKENNKKLVKESEFTFKENARLTGILKALTEVNEKVTKEYNNLVQKHDKIMVDYKFYTAQNKNLLDTLTNDEKENRHLREIVSLQKTDLQQFHIERRRLHNVIQDLKGNIRVFCRVRPPINAEEIDRLQCYINYVDENSLEIRKSRESMNQITGKLQDVKLDFIFDKVFTPESTQKEVFEELSQLVQSALDGYDICVFAYGQTGSGKTHTMQGGEGPESKGMIPRTIDQIFESIALLERSGWKYSVQASFLEIYNENVHDLLNIDNTQKLDICFNDGKGTTVTNLTIQSIDSADELRAYMKLAHKNRATAATNFNEHSSRSHAVTKIYLQGVMNDQNTMYKGSVNLVDLAGSESAKTSVKGERLTETKNINKSLATLGDVISALHCKSKHIPYRNSKLTYLLQSCLGGNSKTLMVVNLAPFEECFVESISSLRFASKVKEVKTGSKRNKMMVLSPVVKRKSAIR